ncbi:MAG TPA: winged helix-turn-helix domain-containing protein [Actinophytocola sp.]|uniref:ArsR/SmtB family transcription factor n=1 Tax=Actinophytocola sp. TaxID=1872138 RepID=UPI002DDCA3C4|nr:winged helix-turn-helix domain-containing protein [Actinophytocola sp.]HEV2781522.1 winged helix-turn-helix domain-containing protein [Actinophytocola sp.]
MLRIHFTSADLLRVTIAERFDPLWEVLSSLYLLQERDSSLTFDYWRRRTRSLCPRAIPLLFELAPPKGYSPDFLTPGRGDTDFDTLLDRLLSTPRMRLQDDLAHLARQQPVSGWTQTLGTGDRHALSQLAKLVCAYHNVGITPYRDQIHVWFKNDRVRRADALLTGGTERLLSSLHPRVIWKPPVLQIMDYGGDFDLYLHGRGLVLLPSLFCRHHPVALRNADLPPVLAYPIHPGIAWLRDPEIATDPAAVLGHTRAAALRSCLSECTTSDLARRIGLSVPAASRQASALREAGLISSHRDGGSVIHHITGLGIALLNGRIPG